MAAYVQWLRRQEGSLTEEADGVQGSLNAGEGERRLLVEVPGPEPVRA
eukprot:CAMPEP_0206007238 /NCGR_PEP_ID=MMETSP1464-20131121/5649_1 /ASSEMBLY_ACC=CAM_ASM_001124 /TAXON_ID=119497 /ORGANISM="Exanthemachrysis gayraliae, Strain RCC1523" /LENGTH=47 /DNA_ID= /DNA_START= /DNA_END= /DNA_ORIENTATION=